MLHKKIVTMILILGSMLNAQSSKNLAQNLRIDSLQNQISEINNQVNNLQESINECKIENDSEKIDRVFNRWVSLQQGLVAVLALLSILMPIITYVFGLRPAINAKRKIKKMEESFENIVRDRLERYIKEISKAEMKNAINGLLSENEELQAKSINFINLNQHIQIDNEERQTVYEALIGDKYNEQIKLPLRLLLSNGKSIWAELYYKYSLSTVSLATANSFYISKYISLYGYTKSKAELINFSKNFGGVKILPAIISTLSIFSLKAIVDFMNDEEILNTMDEQEIKVYKSQLANIAKNYSIPVENTKLWKKAT